MPRKTVKALYHRGCKTLFVDAKSKELNPGYMKYWLEFNKLPTDVKIVYTQDEEFRKNLN